MRLKNVRRSQNVQNRRGAGMTGRVGGLGLVGVLAVLAFSYFTGIDITPLLNEAPSAVQSSRPPTEAEDRAADFSARVLGTTETVWTEIFADQLNRPYDPPLLVLFGGVTQSPCGGASGATGPFYCPVDETAYLDTDFFAELSQRFGAKGDFAAAYVIAHEVAHHVQNQLGILGQINDLRGRASQVQANALTVRLELQADCLAGVWSQAVGHLLDPGDLDEALNAARMIGDDRLQRQAGRVPQPHSFTHGTSEQRARWFATGHDSGRVEACDTFGSDAL
jgi:predicted metalloprotease